MFSPFILQKQPRKPEKVLRAEVLSRDGLAARAAELGEFYSTVQITARGAKLQQRFKENTKILNAAYFAFSEASRRKEVLTAGAEWLLDNYHVIDEQVRDIRRDLPKRYYKALPKLTDSEWKGYPRVYRIVYDFISHTDAIVETESLSTYIEAYQSKTELLIGEIWAVPIMLRLALVENLRRLAQRSLLVAEHRREAEKLCQEIIDAAKTGGADLLITLVNRVKVNPDVLEYGAAHIVRHLRARGGPAALALQWVDEQLRERGLDPNEIARVEQQSQAADQLSVGNSVTALKTIGSLNWRKWFESVSHVDAVLRDDPAGLYSRSDFITRDMYRHKVEKLARASKRTEVEIAEEVVKTADKAALSSDSINDPAIRYRHVGFYLVDEGVEEFKRVLAVRPRLLALIGAFCKRHVLALYLGSIGLVVLAGLLSALHYSLKLGGSSVWLLLLVLLLPLPLSEFAIQIVQWVITKVARPMPLPKLDFDEGISPEAKTIVVVQNIFSDMESVTKACELLEIRAIGNQDENLHFGILGDLCDAETEVTSGDVGIVNRARELVAALNVRYGPRFFMLFRRRQFNPAEGNYMGWERKRGKIEEFNRLLRGAEDTSFNVIIGELEPLKSARFVITLDSDTQLPPGTASKLAGTIAHPLNRAVFNEHTDVVRRGYSIIQPRVGISVQSGNASLFSAVFSGHSGLDPYTRTVSDVYQDLFQEGSYIGKGIYDIDAFERALRGRFPDNSLLSHDLVEGLFARCGLASDIEVFDEYPVRYHAQARRQHRWMRGDWQIIQWLGRLIPNQAGGRYPSPISALGRWKLFDNLRRTLVPPALFLLLLSLWIFAPGSPGAWFGGIVAILSFSVWNMAWRLVFDLPIGYSVSAFTYGFLHDLRKQIELVVFQLVLLPDQAFISANAIVVTLYRVFFSRRHLLEWETAYASEKRLGGGLKDFAANMTPSTGLTAAGALLLFAVGHGIAGVSLACLLVLFAGWFAAPVVAWYISRLRPRKPYRLTTDDEEYLRQVAFATWRYFDSYLKPEYNYLIPDNLQIVPRRVVAERTSPTNISLSVLGVISAYDLGFVPLSGVIDRISSVFNTLLRLERFHGHFLNWYEIRHLHALSPRYISTVDSGNFVGHLIAVYEALGDFPYAPLLTPKHLRHVRSLVRSAKSLPAASLSRINPERPIANLKELIEVLANLDTLRNELVGNGSTEELRRTFEEFCSVGNFLTWTEHLPLLSRLGERQLLPKKLKGIDRILEGRAPTLSLIMKITNRLSKIKDALDPSLLSDAEAAEFEQFLQRLAEAHDRAASLETAITRVRLEIERLARETDFKFLSDPAKNLLIIGYNIDNGQRDNSYYDLFASEARLASLVAIAKGDLPQTHWFMLNRALTDSPGGTALLSWGGTMFEYLMPVLVTKDFPGTLLSETYRAVVKAQRVYARRRHVPWGVSESAFSGVDFENTYQYRAFGIPGLGLKRGLGEDLVVSPYSTMMSLMVDAKHSIANLKVLENDGLRGEFGFYDAVDYTAERLGAEERCHVVRSFLAHHQGMSLVSVNNVLNGDIFQERFHANPAIKACELLLQERFPSRIPVLFPHRAEVASVGAGEDTKAEPFEHFSTAVTRYPRTRILSNGNLTTVVDNSGSGATTFESHIAVNRFRDDALTNCYGTYVYVRDLDSRVFWSAGYEPVCMEPETYEAIFSPDKVELRRRDREITTRTEVTVSPEDNVEIRRVTLTNLSHRLRRIELTSYGEVSLISGKADIAHPAFSKMFLSSEFLPDYEALLFTRKPRDENEGHLYMAHLVQAPGSQVQYETSRLNFLGRGLSARAPIALQHMNPLSGAVGTVLDPVFSLRKKVDVGEGRSETVSFVTAVARSREAIIDLVKKYREGQYVSRAFEMAWSHSDVEMRHQQFSIARVLDFQKLANAIIFNHPRLRAADEILRKNRLSQSALWRFGLSGDEPIVLFTINDREQIKVCEELLLAHEYLRQHGVRFDLVILNEYPGGYFQELQQEIEFLIKTGYSRDFYERSGGVFLRAINQLSEEEAVLLYSVARVVVAANKGPLSSQLALAFKPEQHQPRKRRSTRRQEFVYHPPYEKVEFKNDFGGFADEGRSYSMTVRYDQLPPQPWVNIVANKNFGFLISESGGGYTWSDNSRENKLSPWKNDPVTDSPGEVIYIRDRDTGNYWCPTPHPVQYEQPVRVKHSFGMTTFSTQVNQVFSQLTVSGSTEDKVKWWHLELVNGDFRERNLDLFLYFEPVLGVSREDTYRYLQSSFDSENQILVFSNPYNTDYPRQYLYFGANRSIESFTSSRREFIGRHRDVSNPSALETESTGAGLGIFSGKPSLVHLSGTVGAGFDTCAALKIHVDIPAGEKGHVLFFAAAAESMDEARKGAAKFRSVRTWESSLKQTAEYWNGATDAVQVHTPDRKFDIMVNGWLLYQTVSCRLFARTGFYQSSGAYGFRDQLQDSLALLFAKPEETKKQILLHASRQFIEGDVQHWWHPPTGRGIRTRISDNYLWLPYAVQEYVKVSGDWSILDEEAPFLEAPLLEPGVHDAYNTPSLSTRRGSILQHCLIALDRALTQLSPRALPLIGGGDWNDGFNRVGIRGQGESIWLGWFLAHILSRFSELLPGRDEQRAVLYKRKAEDLVQAIETHGWDGNWYRRAYFDDGTPLGSASNKECRIDSIAQTWGIISDLAQKERRETAIRHVYEHLVREEEKLICLLWPPFENMQRDPGYIQAYPPGIRENGGQYSHAAAWVIAAAALLGDGEKAFSLFNLVNPISHAQDSDGVRRYKTEPYVMCGDVYSCRPHAGRGGWSWYTGSSGWLYRIAVENLVGLKLRGGFFTVHPCIPPQWSDFGFIFTAQAMRFHVRVLNPSHVSSGVLSIELDGVKVENGRVDLASLAASGKTEFTVTVTMGREPVGIEPSVEAAVGVSS